MILDQNLTNEKIFVNQKCSKCEKPISDYEEANNLGVCNDCKCLKL